MAATRYSTNDMRRQIGSPRSKNRDNGDIPCRNITIYGHCKYREAGCSFKHDQNKISAPQPDFSSKKPFNVESPSFTPASTTQQQGTSKKSTLPSQAANAPPFTPRGLNKLPAPSIQKNTEPSILTATSRDFTPSAYDMAIAANGGTQESTATAAGGGGSMYVSDPFASRLNTGVATPSHYHNPYAADQSAVYVQPPGSLPAGVAPPPNYHFYQPLESFKGSLQPWERTPNDFFMPQAVREDYHKKMYATQIVLNTLPSIKEWHSLYPLDVSGKKNPASFGCPSWIYKAYNSKVGRYFALRRLEGFGLSSTAPMERARAWYKIRNTNIVSLFDAFTTGNFGDSSLIFVYDYHPLSKTLQECHFPSGRYRSAQVEEDVLWSYICQISNALRAIHHNNLAARSIEMTKIIVDGNRIRLAACGVLDVTSYGTDHRSIQELQQEDFLKFGTVIFALASGGMVAMPSDARKARELMNPKLSDKLKDAVVWLISSPAHGSQDSKTIDRFLALIAVQMTAHCDRIGQESDYKGEMLAKELENGRIARLMLKLNAINERGDLGNIKDWSETGDRFHLKLFRDYAFHRVDAEGRPDLGIGHMLSCMSKLDTGVDEQIQLISRDNQTVYVISYRQLRQSLNRAFNELLKLSKDGAPGSNPPNLYPPYQMPS